MMTAHLQEHLKRKHGKPEHGKPELGRRILHSTRTRDDWMTFLGVPKEGRLFKRSDNGEFKYATTEQGYQEWCINPSRRWLSKEVSQLFHRAHVRLASGAVVRSLDRRGGRT